MGNCIARFRFIGEDPSGRSPDDPKILRVVRMDGKVLEYSASVLVGDLLQNFDGCGVAISREASRHLPPDHELRIGMVYYLRPFGGLACSAADVVPSSEAEDAKGGGGKRIKVVVTKQQLRELLSKRLSVEEVISGLQRREQQNVGYAESWRPQLQTIPEGSE